jgi:outer membrane immunogenic protein
MRVALFIAAVMLAAQASAQPAARGCYAGVLAGKVFGQSTHLHSSGGDITDNFDLSGRTAGVALGCNWTRGTWLTGVEADLAGADASGKGRDMGFVGGSVTSGTRFDRLATLRARLGRFTSSRLLLYASAGVSGGWAKATIEADDGRSFSDAQKLYGAALGGGAEYWLMRGLTAKVDYLYFAFAKKSFFDPPPPGFIDRGGGIDPEVHVVRVGLNVHF